MEPEDASVQDLQGPICDRVPSLPRPCLQPPNTRKFEVKTPNITIQVNPERTDLLETRMIDGKTYLLIEITDSVEVNGINVRTVERKKDSEN